MFVSHAESLIAKEACVVEEVLHEKKARAALSDCRPGAPLPCVQNTGQVIVMDEPLPSAPPPVHTQKCVLIGREEYSQRTNCSSVKAYG